MKNEEAWKVITSNLPKLVDFMVTVQEGTWVDVFCDPTGRNLAFSKPSGDASIKLCGVTAPDLGHYGLRREGAFVVADDGSDEPKIPGSRLAALLAQRIVDMINDGGAEWGWEFKVCGDP